MWKIRILTFLSIFMVIFAEDNIFRCPQQSTCTEDGTVLSNSFEFMEKLDTKEFRTIIKLSVINGSITKVPSELKYLKNLEYLDLSNNNVQVRSIPKTLSIRTLILKNNNIKDINFAFLPKKIKEIDLSHNYLTQMPKDWNALVLLKILHLDNNLIDCECSINNNNNNNNIFEYEKIISQGVHIPEPVLCHKPHNVAGKEINSINCNINFEMVGDENVEGSGSGTIIISDDIFQTDNSFLSAPVIQENELSEYEELILDGINNVNNTVQPAEEEEEDSGNSEGSGFLPIDEDLKIPTCVYDCLTPKVINTSNDTKIDPLIGLKTIVEDFYQPILREFQESTTLNYSSTSSTDTAESSSSLNNIVPFIKEANPNRSEDDDDVHEEISKMNQTEVFMVQTHQTGEMEKAVALNNNNYAVYVVVVCGLFLAIVFLACFIKTRKTKRLNKNRRNLLTTSNKEDNNGKEMKPLKSSTLFHGINEKKNGNLPIIHTSSPSEQVPLVNGENGQIIKKRLNDDPILKSYTPLEYPHLDKENKVNNDHDDDDDDDEPLSAADIRKKNEIRTPITERVTIRASEIPESLPKTPILLHRLKNSEGELITTVLSP